MGQAFSIAFPIEIPIEYRLASAIGGALCGGNLFGYGVDLLTSPQRDSRKMGTGGAFMFCGIGIFALSLDPMVVMQLLKMAGF